MQGKDKDTKSFRRLEELPSPGTRFRLSLRDARRPETKRAEPPKPELENDDELDELEQDEQPATPPEPAKPEAPKKRS